MNVNKNEDEGGGVERHIWRKNVHSQIFSSMSRNTSSQIRGQYTLIQYNTEINWKIDKNHSNTEIHWIVVTLFKNLVFWFVAFVFKGSSTTYFTVRTACSFATAANSDIF